MDKETLKKSVNLNLRCVTQSCKGGVPLNRLEKDYKDLIGEPIPINKLGYNSIALFLQSIPDVVHLKKSNDGQIIVEGVADASTAHIANLISRQKSAKTRKGTSKKPSLQIRKYSCHESWRSSSSNSAEAHKQDNKASVSHPAKLKMPTLKNSNAELLSIEHFNSASTNVASSTKSLTGLPPVWIPNRCYQTDTQQETSQLADSMLADKEKVSNQVLVQVQNVATDTPLTGRRGQRRRRKMREAAQDLLKMSGASLTKSELQKNVKKAQKLGLTTPEFLERLKKNLNSSTLMENQDPIKNVEHLSKEKQNLKSLTLRNIWNVTFRFADGVSLCHLPHEYKTLFGTHIPYKELGYKSLKSFIQAIPDVIHLIDKEGQEYAEAVRDTNSKTSSLASQHKELPSTSNESLNCASPSGWETSSNSSSNTSKILPAPDLKTSVERSLGSIQSVLSSYTTIASIPLSPATKEKQVLPSTSKAATSESGVIDHVDKSRYVPPHLRNRPTIFQNSKEIVQYNAAKRETKDMFEEESHETKNNGSGGSFNRDSYKVSSNELNISELGYKPALNDFPQIKSSIARAQFNSLLLMNILLYDDDSMMGILKRGILAFDGFPFSEDSDEWNQKQLLLSMMPVDTLQECLNMLCIECDSKNKHVLIYKLMQFLSSPSKALSERKN